MSKHYGDPVEEPPRVVHRNRLLKLGLGVTLAVVAWGYLVSAAIHFGGQGRDGESGAWVFMAFATIGATACMFVMLILASKVLSTLRGEVPIRPAPGGGKRARR
ncbi:hypothetical protein [Nocardioides marmorisolisilvae]|uniref:hypothetical protein n=1 Tax=Nocardioides marmorisolisilvae TaxID=1542737 RepID=UPI0011CE85F4|nr:hypothetical protein [Nocardioides marmorisolisilvae]